jgi:hypothetical protein
MSTNVSAERGAGFPRILEPTGVLAWQGLLD